MNPLYTVTAHATGGRQGRVSSDAHEWLVEPPKELTGKDVPEATNPEQLFAAGYGACFLSALSLTARAQKISARDFSLDSEVVLGAEDGGFGISVTLDCSLPGVEADKAAELVRSAHEACPYSKATRGNIPVQLKVDGTPV